MYLLEALRGDVYAREGEKLAEDPAAGRTIEEGVSARNDCRPSALSPATDPGERRTVLLCLTEETVLLASSMIGCC
jgi:hypothetical protein